jgi:hypothetical protein
MHPNPFSVGTTRPANYMFGRGGQLRAIERWAYEIQNERHPDPICFCGATGTGKTSLLKYAQDTLREKGWLCGYSEASPDASSAIDDFLDDVRRELPRGRIPEKFISRISELSVSAVGLSAGIKIGDVGQRTAYARVREIFSILGEIAKKTGTGVALLIDEAQVLPQHDLRLLFRAIESLHGYPVSLIVAGLPGVAGNISGVDDKRELSGPSVLFPPHLSPLSLSESSEALYVPVEDQGGIIEGLAAIAMTGFAEGHPLTLRKVGGSAWEFADQDADDSSPVTIKEKHANRAIREVGRQLKLAYHEPMWQRSTDAQRKVMIALATSSALDIMGQRSDISNVTRNAHDVLYELFCRGVVYEDGDDRGIDFTIPGFYAYVQSKARSM